MKHYKNHYLGAAVVTNGTCNNVAAFTIEVMFSKVVQNLGPPTVSNVLTVLHHAEQVVNVHTLGVVGGVLIHCTKNTLLHLELTLVTMRYSGFFFKL